MSPKVRPAGLAAERTALAWSRSALALATIAGLLLHAALSSGVQPLVLAAAVALLACAVVVWRRSLAVYRRRLETPPLNEQPEAIRAMSAVTLTTALVVLAVIVAR